MKHIDPDPEVSPGLSTIGHWIVKVRNDGRSECRDHLAVEEPLRYVVKG